MTGEPVKLVLDKDYYMDGEYMVFTEAYLKKRGECCKNECKHCPWEFKSNKKTEEKTA